MNINTIILTGPLAVGKSSIALKLSEKLNLINYPIDRLKWYYRFKNGYNLVIGTKILKEQGFGALIKYAKPYFKEEDLKTIFSEFSGVIDLGATDSYCPDIKTYNSLLDLFQPFNYVFLLLPNKDLKISEKILNKRLLDRYEKHPFKDLVIDSYLRKNKEFLLNSTKYLLAKHIIYTDNKTIDEICIEIINKIKIQDLTNTQIAV